MHPVGHIAGIAQQFGPYLAHRSFTGQVADLVQHGLHALGNAGKGRRQHIDRSIAVLHCRFDLDCRQLQHQHRFTHLTPVEVGVVGTATAGKAIVCVIVHAEILRSRREI